MSKITLSSGVGIKAPQNSKSLLNFIFKTMEAVANGDIDNATANSIAGLAAQANNVIKNELTRTAIQLRMLEQNADIDAHDVRIRNLENKSFAECGRDYEEVEERE